MEPDKSVDPAQRVFFALWPDVHVRAGLTLAARRMHRMLGGRRVRQENLHLTLAFIGDVDPNGFARLRGLPDAVLTNAFRMTLDHWDCWSHNGIGWTGPTRTPESLRRLSQNLAAWLRGIGFRIEDRRFMAHVTLLRDARCAPMIEPMLPIEWPVGELALVRSNLSRKGARYEVAASWPMA